MEGIFSQKHLTQITVDSKDRKVRSPYTGEFQYLEALDASLSSELIHSLMISFPWITYDFFLASVSRQLKGPSKSNMIYLSMVTGTGKTGKLKNGKGNTFDWRYGNLDKGGELMRDGNL